MHLWQWQILIQKSDIADWYKAALCTLPLDLTSGSRFATDFSPGKFSSD
jgi:hypothetical protein